MPNLSKNQCASAEPVCVTLPTGQTVCSVKPEPCFDAKPVPVDSGVMLLLIVLIVGIIARAALRGK